MRIIIIITLFLSYCSACRRADTYPEYKPIIGKYKLVYVNKRSNAWPLDSFVRVNLPDKYEIEFRKLSKVRLYKNDNCEKAMKIYSCKRDILNPQNPTVYYYMTIDKKDYQFLFQYYPSVGSTTDTLFVDTFYPFETTDNGDNYFSYYIKE